MKVNGKPFAIKSVTINAKDATLLNIKLVEPSYRSDVISISLLPGSPLTSTDERVPQVFTEVPVGMHNVNLLPEAVYGFEGGGTGWVPIWDNTAAYEFTTEKAAGGKYSLLIKAVSGKGTFTSEKAPITLKSGTKYTYRYKVWVDPATPAAFINTWILPNYQQMWQSLNGRKTGKWETVTRDLKYDGDPNGRFLFIHCPEAGTYYVDDLYLVVKEVKPQ